ncbi:hypothetical protein [Acidisphaera sp. S103]|uniref:hypothetical protein n=1 Tax=Acidisphaera sp. S103 TaxID=1747223 RepID=UPI00131E88FB|nr:hypothetical protein [Acidisphaera sp. S103]
MPRRSIRRPELERYQRELARIIDDALNRGQCGDGTPERHWKPWTNTQFADIAGISERSVANWRDPDALMPPYEITPLLKCLYGDIDRFKADRAAMHRLWQLARGHITAHEVPSTDPRSDKSPNLRGKATLITLQAHAPTPLEDGTMRLSITLIISPDRDLSYRGKAITIGLAEALLTVEPGLYQPTHRSRPSQRGLRNFKISAAGERIIGPLDRTSGMIDGEPLDDEYLMDLEVAESGAGPINIIVHASRNSFRARISPLSGTEAKMPQHCSINQNVVMNALFYEQLKNQDCHNRAVLARITVGLGSP